MKQDKGFLLPIIFIGVALLLVVGAYYFGMQKNQNTPKVESSTSLNVATQSNAPLSNLPKAEQQAKTTQGVRTDFMGPYSFEYPVNWHVASQWSDKQGGPIVIGINPEPINGGPRDGPYAAIDVLDWNGLQNPEAKFNELLTTQKSNLKAGFLEETLQSEVGQIYHYSGKLTGPMLEDVPRESYVLMIPSSSPTDKLNYRVLEVSTLNNSASSEVLKHLVLSFKRVIR